MKLSHIIKNVDKSDSNKCRVDLQNLAESLDVIEAPSCYVDEEENPITCYHYASWMCTDTVVGGLVYFYKDEPFATSWQPARKSDEVFTFVSKELVDQVREYLLSLVWVDEIKITDPETIEVGEGFKLIYNQQVLRPLTKCLHNGRVASVSRGDYQDTKSWVRAVVTYEDSGAVENVLMSELRFPYILKEKLREETQS